MKQITGTKKPTSGALCSNMNKIIRWNQTSKKCSQSSLATHSSITSCAHSSIGKNWKEIWEQSRKMTWKHFLKTPNTRSASRESTRTAYTKHSRMTLKIMEFLHSGIRSSTLVCWTNSSRIKNLSTIVQWNFIELKITKSFRSATSCLDSYQARKRWRR